MHILMHNLFNARHFFMDMKRLYIENEMYNSEVYHPFSFVFKTANANYIYIVGWQFGSPKKTVLRFTNSTLTVFHWK